MIKLDNIEELIGKFFSGEASPEEAMLLEDWKNDHPDNMLHYSYSEKMFSLIHNERITREPDSKRAWEKVRNKIEVPVKVIPLNRKRSAWVAAASILLLIGTGILLNYLLRGNKQQDMVYVTEKEVKEVKLLDGTVISISPNSVLTVDKNFANNNRTIRLKGEANFSVVHQEKLPFIVDMDGVFIKDIGTVFSVRSSTDTVFVKVDEGVVLLYDSIGSSLEINATEKALYIRSIKKIMSDITSQKLNTSVQFSNSSLEEVVRKLNTIYNTAIILENDKLKNCTITTQFDKENLETVLGIITETLGLSYEKTPTGYLIKGQSCQPQ